MSSGLYSTEKREFDTTLDLTKLRPYGDTMNDGKVQMSFTLPVPCNEKGVEAALELARKMGFVNPAVAFSEALDKEFSFYVVYGATSYNVDYTAIKVQALEIDTMDMHECEKYIEENFGREVVMVGAMRPSTGMSVDGPLNLYNAVAVASDKNAQNRGVMVVMNDVVLDAKDVIKTNTLAVETFKGAKKSDTIELKYDEKKHTADKYLSKFANTAGCIHEEDGYTKLIKKAIEWISQDHSLNGKVKKAKKPVLIIEDLDRLDPKHLFRILNVVSAHIDDSDRPDIVGNKFGFSNIVLVMDYEADSTCKCTTPQSYKIFS